MKLRSYQTAALAEIERRAAAGDVRIPMVLATGLGKTQIFCSYTDQWLAEHPGQRALIIAHTDELIEQAAKRARQLAPGRRVGIVKAAQNEVLAEIIVSSRQTLAGQGRRNQLKRIGLIIVDEAHHAVRTNTYGRILEHFGAFDDPSPVLTLGFTATLARSDKAKLSSVWQKCSFTRDILFGIRNGYLLDVRGERVVVPDFDMSNVRVTRGDYSDSDLADEMERTFAPEVIAQKYVELAAGRRGLAFWPLVSTAYHGAKAFNEVGIRSEVVHGGTPKPERRELLQRFHLPLTHDEAIDVMHNAMVLIEGFDEPTADVVVNARPTRSTVLYQQMVGRILRPDLTVAPELREKALILDTTGASENNDLRNLIDLSPERPLKLNPDDENASLLELDEYLLQIEEELDAQRAGGTYEFESPAYVGATETKAFDPLGRQKVWGQTPGGMYYIKAGSVGFVFVVESARVRAEADVNTYDVVVCSVDNGPTRYNGGTPAWARLTPHTDLPLEEALAWGEDVAVETGGTGTITLTSRKSAWRKKEPSAGLCRLAAVYGIRAYDENGAHLFTMGELSEAVNAAQATRRIDPMIASREALVRAELQNSEKVNA